MRVAVAGNPNCGKSTLFNALSGARARVGNYPGVTVERKSAPFSLPNGRQGELIDLPGCTSLIARSYEEDIAHGVLMGGLGTGLEAAAVDAVISVVDATQLGRGLYLVLQLKELGLRQVVALNMMDAAEAQGMRIHVASLARLLGLRVAPMVAQRGEGLDGLRTCLDGATMPVETDDAALAHLALSADERRILAALQAQLPAMRLGGVLWLVCSSPEHSSGGALGLWTSILADDRRHAAVQQARAALDALAGPEGFGRSIIARRYAAVDRAMAQTYLHCGTPQDARTMRMDKLLLHPVAGPVLFVCTMFALFQGVFLGAEPMMAMVENAVGYLAQWAAQMLPDSLFGALLVEGVLPGLGSVVSFVPQIALLFAGLAMLDESGYMSRAAFLLDALMRRVGLHGKAFIPLLSSFGCAIPGIMAARTIESPRDRLVTILIAPFMSCSARLPVYTLVIAATLAHLPPLWGIVSIGGLAIFGMYALGFVAAIGTAFVLKRTALRAPAPPLLLDLPRLQLPRLGAVLRTTYERCAVFIRQTGPIILALSILLWGALNFPRQGLNVQERARQEARIAILAPAAQQPAHNALARQDQALILEHSLGGRVGHAIEPLIKPLGFDWRIGIALVASFAAREVLVSTLGQIYALDADTPPTSPALRQALRSDVDPQTGQPRFTWLVGLSLMVFFVLALQCLSTVAVVKRETGGWRWPLLQLGAMNALAYVASFAVYQGGHALGWG